MGLSIHYSGRIAKPGLLHELINEIEDIVSIHNWKYEVYERVFPENGFGDPDYNQTIYGISFTPPECETIPVCFLSNGRMSSLIHLDFFGKRDKQLESKYLYMLSVKTQFTGVVAHQLIIHLFRYLSEKYLTDFKLIDEGKYWETNDVELLATNFKKINDLINSISSVVEYVPMQPGETIETYFERVLKLIKQTR